MDDWSEEQTAIVAKISLTSACGGVRVCVGAGWWSGVKWNFSEISENVFVLSESTK